MGSPLESGGGFLINVFIVQKKIKIEIEDIFLEGLTKPTHLKV